MSSLKKKLLKMNNRLILIFFLISLASSVLAQDNNNDLGIQEVQITQTYIPKLPLSEKINTVPKLIDTIQSKTTFNYYPINKSFNTQLSLEPIQAAKIKGEPLNKIYNTLFYGGVGNMSMPTSKLYYSSDRNKKTTYGFEIGYIESYANVKSTFNEDEKVDASFRETDIAFYAKNDTELGILNAYASRKGKKLQAYGYNSILFSSEEIRNPEYWGYTDFGISLKSKHTDANRLQYYTKLHAYDLNEFIENSIDWQLSLKQTYNYYDYALTLGVDYDFNNLSESYQLADSLSKELILTFKPTITREFKGGKMKIGFELQSYDIRDTSSVRVSVYPILRYMYPISDKYQLVYGGIRGGLIENSYHTLSKANPYILNPQVFDGDGLSLINSKTIYDGFIGLKSHLASNMQFDTELSYSRVLDMSFFELDTNSTHQNKFRSVYDDVSLFTIQSNLLWQFNQSGQLGFHMKYNRYTTDSLVYYAYKPTLTTSVWVQYNIGDKIIPQIEVFSAFNRSKTSPTSHVPELNDIIDFNMQLEYRYNTVFSAYFKAYNLISNYQVWQNYSALGPQVFFGLSFKL